MCFVPPRILFIHCLASIPQPFNISDHDLGQSARSGYIVHRSGLCDAREPLPGSPKFEDQKVHHPIVNLNLSSAGKMKLASLLAVPFLFTSALAVDSDFLCGLNTIGGCCTQFFTNEFDEYAFGTGCTYIQTSRRMTSTNLATQVNSQQVFLPETM